MAKAVPGDTAASCSSSVDPLGIDTDEDIAGGGFPVTNLRNARIVVDWNWSQSATVTAGSVQTVSKIQYRLSSGGGWQNVISIIEDTDTGSSPYSDSDSGSSSVDLGIADIDEVDMRVYTEVSGGTNVNASAAAAITNWFVAHAFAGGIIDA
jgi:hypothetical protein